MMKQRTLWLFAVILTFLGNHDTMAQDVVSDSIYVPLPMMPKPTLFLPAPPDSVSPEFVDDMLQWQWGKSVRATERGNVTTLRAQLPPRRYPCYRPDPWHRDTKQPQDPQEIKS